MYRMDEVRSTDFFYDDDLELIEERFGDKLSYLSPSESVQSDVTFNKKPIKLRMECIDAGYDKVQDIKMLYGRMINKSDIDRKSKSVVLEQNAAIKLFGKENVIGNSIRVKTK